MHGLPAEADGGKEYGEARHALGLAHVGRVARVHLFLQQEARLDQTPSCYTLNSILDWTGTK